MIRCQCVEPHRDHPFRGKDDAWGLCRDCGHTLGAHKPTLDEARQELIDMVNRAETMEIIPIGIFGNEVRVEVRCKVSA